MVQENNIDSEAFWSLDDTQVKEILKVEAYGDRKHLLTVMAEIKSKHLETEKLKKLELESDIKINRDEIISLVQSAA